MAENTSSNQNSNTTPKEKIWYDPEEYAIRKRLPPNLPRRPIDIYITNKTAFKAQIERCQSLLDKGKYILISRNFQKKNKDYSMFL